jgi:hypothetical protein
MTYESGSLHSRGWAGVHNKGIESLNTFLSCGGAAHTSAFLRVCHSGTEPEKHHGF